MFVKICGITRADDAEAAVAAGAQRPGIRLLARQPPVRGPVSGEGHRRHAAALRDARRRVRESAGGPRAGGGQPGSAGRRAVARRRGRAVRPIPRRAGDQGGERRRPPARAGGRGGICCSSTRTIRCGGAARAARRGWDGAAVLAAGRPILLAGGLTPTNVADAIARVRPFGIDVSSGVERSPGVKDHQRLRALFEVVHGTR